EQYLGMAHESLKVQLLQQVVTAIATAHPDNRSDIVTFQETFQFAQTAVGAAGKKENTVEDVGGINQPKYHLLQPGAAGKKAFFIEAAGRGHKRDLVAATERWRPDELRTWPSQRIPLGRRSGRVPAGRLGRLSSEPLANLREHGH